MLECCGCVSSDPIRYFYLSNIAYHVPVMPYCNNEKKNKGDIQKPGVRYKLPSD